MRNLSVPSFQTDYSSSNPNPNPISVSISSSSSTTSTSTTSTSSTSTSTSSSLECSLIANKKKILEKQVLEDSLSKDTTENSVISLSSLENKTNSEFPFLKGICPLKKKMYSDVYSNDLIDLERKIIDKQLKKKYKKEKCHSHSIPKSQRNHTRPKAVAGIIAISLSPKSSKYSSPSFSLPDTSQLLKSTDSDKEKLRKIFSGTNLFDSTSNSLYATNTQQEKLLQEVLGSLTESLREYEKEKESSEEPPERKSSLIELNLPTFVETESENSDKKSVLQNESQSKTTTLTETQTPSVEITTTETIPSESQNPVTMFDSVRKILGLQTK